MIITWPTRNGLELVPPGITEGIYGKGKLNQADLGLETHEDTETNMRSYFVKFACRDILFTILPLCLFLTLRKQTWPPVATKTVGTQPALAASMAKQYSLIYLVC